MKSNVNWTVVFLFIVGFLFFILSVSAEDIHDKVVDLFISGFYFIFAFSSAIESK